MLLSAPEGQEGDLLYRQQAGAHSPVRQPRGQDRGEGLREELAARDETIRVRVPERRQGLSILDRLEERRCNTLREIALRHSAGGHPLVEEVSQQSADGHTVVESLLEVLRSDPAYKFGEEAVKAGTPARVQYAPVVRHPHLREGVAGSPPVDLHRVLPADGAGSVAGLKAVALCGWEEVRIELPRAKQSDQLCSTGCAEYVLRPLG